MSFTTVEYKEFRKSCEKHLGAEQNQLIANYLSENPKLGELVNETGGIRKLQWPTNTKHKDEVKGVIYYYYKDRSNPVYLISVFRPGVKQALSKVIELIVTQ